jgi:hypothetical protein
MCDILSDLVAARVGWRVSLLRYFNPVGAHPSGLIGHMVPEIGEARTRHQPDVFRPMHRHPHSSSTGER